ncbi:MAG: ABC transporter permease, partial [Acidobacteriota bacterium]
ANSAIFQLIHVLQLRELPVREAGQLVAVRKGENFYTGGRFSGRNSPLTYPQIEHLEKTQRAFSSLIAVGTTRFELSRGGDTRPASGLYVSPNFFTDLGVEPVLGSGFANVSDPRDCSEPGAVIGHSFWQREMGGDRDIIGREISVDGFLLPVVGVTPEWFFGLEPALRFDVAVPICVDTLMFGSASARMDDRSAWWLTAIGRLKAGWTVERASAHLKELSPELFRQTVPAIYQPDAIDSYLANTLLGVSARAGVSTVRETYRTPLLVLLASTGLVLLLACANLANLLLVRASVRGREIALRQAVGASRRRLIGQLMLESLLLAACGALVGVAMAQGLSRAMVFFLDAGSGTLQFRLGIDWQILAFTGALATLTCLLFGWVPALRAASCQPADAMRGGRGSDASSESHGLRRALVVLQIGLSFTLLVGALLFGQSLRNLTSQDSGLVGKGVWIVSVAASADLGRDSEAARRLQTYGQLEERLASISGVSSAGAVLLSPFGGNGWNQQVYAADAAGSEGYQTGWFNRVGPNYFATVQTPLVAGRAFTRADREGSAPVAIVDQHLAQTLFGDENPIGRTVRYRARAGLEDPGYEIVGVVGNSKFASLRENQRAWVYLPMAQDEKPAGFMAYALRFEGAASELQAAVREHARSLDGGLIVSYLKLDRAIHDSLLRERLMANLSAGFGILAALLSALGLYGVMSYTVTCRRREMGVRMALGASARDVVSLVSREAARLLVAGLLVGSLATLGLARFAESMLFGLAPHDPTILVLGCVLLGASAGLALWGPLRRASRYEPAIVLRGD